MSTHSSFKLTGATAGYHGGYPHHFNTSHNVSYYSPKEASYAPKCNSSYHAFGTASGDGPGPHAVKLLSPPFEPGVRVIKSNETNNCSISPQVFPPAPGPNWLPSPGFGTNGTGGCGIPTVEEIEGFDGSSWGFPVRLAVFVLIIMLIVSLVNNKN